MIHKKIICVILATFFVILSGCSSKTTNPNKIVVWHWINDRHQVFEQLAAEYKTQSGIEVEFKLFSPPDIYSQKVFAAARAGTLPDIFGLIGKKKILGSFVKGGYVADLTPYMKAQNNRWLERFYPKTLEVVVFRPNNSYKTPAGIYGVPIDTTLMQFLYNKDLLKEAGLDPDHPPQTLDQFIEYAKIIKKETSADGFICGWGDSWLLSSIAMQWAINLMGEEKYFKTLQGEVPYTDKDWIKVFSLFIKLKDSGILASNITTITNKEAEDAFTKNKAAFSYNGTWGVNVYKQLAFDLDYAFMPLPTVSDKFPALVWGGGGSPFMVSAKSTNKEKAIEFLKWLTEINQQKFLIKNTDNLPSIKGCEGELSPALRQLLPSFELFTHPNTWPANESSQIMDKISVGLQQLIMGLTTPQKLASLVQKTKERVSKR